MKKITPHTQAALLTSFAVLLFGFIGTGVKLQSETISIWQVIWGRCFFALPVLIFIAIYQRRSTSLYKTQHFREHMIRAFFGIIGMGLFFLSFTLMPLANAYCLSYAGPLLLSILGVWWLKEKLSKLQFTIIVIGFLGVLVASFPTTTVWHPLGVAAALGSAFAYACSMLAVKKVAAIDGALTIVFYFSLVASIVFLPPALLSWKAVSLNNFIFLFIIGTFAAIAQLMIVVSLRIAPASWVAPFNYSSIIWVSILEWLTWGQVITWNVAIGSIIVIFSNLMLVKSKHQNIPKISTIPTD